MRVLRQPGTTSGRRSSSTSSTSSSRSCTTATARFRTLLHLGLTDAFRSLHPEPHQYSYWDYVQRRWELDHGLRIDHLLLSPQAADRLVESGIDKDPRGRERASDHTPVWCTLADA